MPPSFDPRSLARLCNSQRPDDDHDARVAPQSPLSVSSNESTAFLREILPLFVFVSVEYLNMKLGARIKHVHAEGEGVFPKADSALEL